eukprot:1157902-Pelagomonas_calceolata.AAC.19
MRHVQSLKASRAAVCEGGLTCEPPAALRQGCVLQCALAAGGCLPARPAARRPLLGSLLPLVPPARACGMQR